MPMQVGSGADGYRLRVGRFLGGDAGDSLSYENGMPFSTFDRDQDATDDRHCALEYQGYRSLLTLRICSLSSILMESSAYYRYVHTYCTYVCTSVSASPD